MSTILMMQPPVSVSVKTAGYTIPAGRVARCIVNLEGAATFTIDGVTALRGTTNSVIVPNGNSYRTSGTPTGLNASTQPGLPLAANGTTTGTASTAVVTVYGTDTDNKTTIAEVRLPAGTVINGTGVFRVVVEEYYS